MYRDVSKRRLLAGIVGGGQGSLIGTVHRMAAELDGQAEVVAGAMSSHSQRAKESADLTTFVIRQKREHVFRRGILRVI